MIVLVILLILIPVVALLYFMAIMPHMTNRPDLVPFKGWMYAHRGLHDNAGDAPENTLAAFQKAVDAGYGIELDIQLTKDRIPVVVHDENLKRVCGADVRVDSLNLKELQEKYRIYNSNEYVPTFVEVLELVAGKVPLIVEFKGETSDLSLCPIAAKILDEYQGTWCMESFNPLMVRWYRKNRPGVMRGQLSGNFIKGDIKGNPVLHWLMQNLMFNFLTKPDFIAFDHKYQDMVAFTLNKRIYHIPTFAWTIKSQEELEAARAKYDFMIFDSFIPAEKGF